MAQNIYDTPGFFAGYSRLSRSVHGLDGAPEWAALRAMLPGVDGKAIVDLGCGFGWFARWASAQGAANVVGVDLSENMLARARAETPDSTVQYIRMDLDSLALPARAFELAFSSLALHYIKDFSRLVGTVFQALVPDGNFVFTIEHPIYMAPVCPGWTVDQNGRKSWPINDYANEGERRTDWLAPGVVKYHRTMGTTLNTLINTGFSVRHVQEWHPAPEQVEHRPSLAEEMDRPMMLLIAAQK